MKIKASDAATLVGGKLIGNPATEFFNIAKIESAGDGDLSFLYLPSYKKFLENSKASVIITKEEFVDEKLNTAFIVVEKPDLALHKIILHYFNPVFELEGVDDSAYVSPTAILGKNVALGKNVVISDGCSIGDNSKIFHNSVICKDVKIGENVLFHPNVTIREKCIIGNNVILHPGVVIGADGFGYNPTPTGSYIKIPQIGIVIIEDDVELGANTTVDRGAISPTIVGKGTKIDNLVMVAHGVTIGKHTVASAQCGFSGSTKVGDYCIFGGQAGITGHIEIEDHVFVGAQSGVSKSLKKGQYFGAPARDLRAAYKIEAHLNHLPEYALRIKELENEIKKIKESLNK